MKGDMGLEGPVGNDGRPGGIGNLFVHKLLFMRTTHN